MFYRPIDFLIRRVRHPPLAEKSVARLEDVRAELHDKDTVCFLGEVKSGKTVSSSLLKHAVVNHFVPRHPDDYQAIVSQGMEAVNRSLGDIILHKQFPASTLPVDNPRVVLNIYKMSGNRAGKYEIILQDSSGEHFFNYLIQECHDPNNRLHEMLDQSLDSDKVSPLAYYIFARLYILTVDCSDIAALEHKQSLLANAITALHKLHTAASITRNKKIDSAIAIVFTKSDLLNGDDSSQSPTKLLDHMPELKTALNVLHGGALECFKVSISTCTESEHDRNERVEREKQLYDKEYAKTVGRRRAVEDKIAAMCARELKKMEDSYGYTDLEAHMSEYEEKLRGKMRLDPLPENFDKESVGQGQTHRPVSPLTYTHDEYVRLIIWIISQLVVLR